MPKGKNRDLAQRIEDLAAKIADAEWQHKRRAQRIQQMRELHDRLLGDARRAVEKAG